MQYFLKKLSPDDGQDVYNMLQQIPAEENGFVNPAHGMEYIAFQTWLTNCDLNSKKTGLEDGWRVPASIFWLYVDGKPVGIGKLRHFLTEALYEAGGSIGCSIVPPERGKGYGTLLLQELLREARKMGIEQALLTIRPDNTPSLKVALNNGGTLDRATDAHCYIWVDTKR